MKQTGKIKQSMLFFMLLMCAFHIIDAQNTLSKKLSIDYLIAQASCSEWQLVKEGDGVNIHTRWLNFGDSIKTREIAIRFITVASVNDVLYNLRSKLALKQWNNNVRELQVLNSTDSTWVTHMVFDIPYPLSQQDLVTKNTIVEHSENLVIDVQAQPELVEIRDNIIRQQYYYGQWLIKVLDSNRIEVRFSAISFSKSNIPRFIRDPIVQSKLLSSFIKLKELSIRQARLTAAIHNK